MAPRSTESVDAYLEELPEDRRAAVAAVREVVLANLPDGYEEALRWGMIAYEVPLSRCPDTYNGHPLQYVALASQKRHMSLYLNGIYGDEAASASFAERYAATGKRLDMGKSCVRFRRLDDLPLDLVAEVVASTSVDELIAQHAAARS